MPHPEKVMPHPETLVVLRKELEESRGRIATAVTAAVNRFGGLSHLADCPELDHIRELVLAHESCRRKYAAAIEALKP